MRKARPLLCLYVRLRRETIAELLPAISPERLPPAVVPRTIEAVPMDAEISDALLRLLRTMRSPDDARILGPQLVREIVYRVLTGLQGSALRAMVGFDSHLSQISRALHQIHRDYQIDHLRERFSRRLECVRPPGAAREVHGSHDGQPGFHSGRREPDRTAQRTSQSS